MNKSNFVHAAFAVGFQLAVGLPAFVLWGWTLPTFGAGLFIVGFFVGVEWMQQINMNLLREYRPWPDVLSVRDILNGFKWSKLDRYLDCGLPAVAVTLIYLGAVYGNTI